jgi:tetratricopeptide (TPR) repeat protein
LRNQNPTNPGARELSLKKKLVFSVLIVTGFFLLLEFVLLLAGVKPGADFKDPFVGFSGSLPLFVEERGDDGRIYLETAPNKLSWFNASRFAKQKPEGVYRVFSLGGSTTYGRPYTDPLSFSGWLRDYLPLADPARNWEVINAGGISYASYRITVLMEELLAYQPDLFLIYTGHNEFLERRTYASLTGTPKPVTAIAGLAARTRTYAAGQLLIDAVTSAPRKTVLQNEVNAILDHSVGPAAYHRDDAQRASTFEHFRYNLNRMVDLARSSGARVVLITPVSNLKDSSPFKSEPSALEPAASNRRREVEAAASAAAGSDDWEKAARLYAEAVAIDNRDAGLHYQLGRALYQLQRYPEATAAFVRAREEDVCPLRAPSEIVRITREVAAARSVPLVDFERVVEAASSHGITGSDHFLDHVHLNAEGYGLLAREIVGTLVGAGTITLSDAWNGGNLEAARMHVLARLDPAAYAESLLNLGKVLSWAGKIQEAERFAIQAQEILGGNPEARGIQGHAALTRGDYDLAEKYLREALDSAPGLGFARFDLGTTLYLQGRYQEAIGEFNEAATLEPTVQADVRNNLGLCYHALGQFDQALAAYESALEADPGKLDARNNLGVALLALGRYREALDNFQEAAVEEPDAKTLFNVGAAQEALGEHASAVASFREATVLDSSYAQAFNGIGLNLLMQGLTEEAIESLEEAVRLRPEFAEAHDHLGAACMNAARPACAERQFLEAARLRPEWPQPLLNLSDLYNTATDPAYHRPEAAAELVRRAAALQP